MSIQKRDLKRDDDSFSIPSKTLKLNNADDDKLSKFLSWCSLEGLSISKSVNMLLCTRGGVVTNALETNVPSVDIK